ncbi:indole-3-glycerol phosphate synthase TrpC [Muriicola sp. E247]|uniref:indole-3-glycerol phosphate synthase TrpC n=1 Tax=Muriicola sp. E247 TaxID=3242730 RepID=UPI003524D723
MDILQKIVKHKKREVALKKELVPVHQLEASSLFQRPALSLSAALRKSASGVIAEFKRRSPSKSVINHHSPVHEVAMGYEQAGICGMSVLTDGHFFGGSLEDLQMARATTNIPLLRKDFMIDEYQFFEARAHGADVILLIAAILDKNTIRRFTDLAHELGLEVLLEVHDEKELMRSLLPDIDMIGVNNRNLKTFEVSLETSRKLAADIPGEIVKVSESGLSNIESIRELRGMGYRGFLIGETFMATEDPGRKATEFIKTLEQ